MRHREIGSIGPTAFTLRHHVVNKYYDVFTGAFLFEEEYINSTETGDCQEGSVEAMDDVVSQGHVDHPCVHTIREIRRGGLIHGHHTDTYVDGIYQRVGETDMSVDGLVYDWPTVPIPSPSSLTRGDWAEFVFEHSIKCQNAIQSQISLPNFLLELGDIKRTFEAAKDLLNKFSDTRLDRRVGNAVLGSEFGLKPLISDLATLARWPDKIASQLSWLKRNLGKPVRIVTTQNLELDDETLASQHPATWNGIGSRRQSSHSFRATQVELRAVSWVIFEQNNLDDFELAATAVAGSLGFSNPAKVAWNAIPYSFVVDWLINFGAFLEHAELTAALLPSRTLKTTAHITMVREVVGEVSWYGGASSEPAVIHQQPFATYATKYYQRWVGLPEADSLIFRSPSLRELLLSLFLIHQKIPTQRYKKIARWATRLDRRWQQYQRKITR